MTKNDSESRMITGRFSQAILLGARKRTWQIWRMAEEAKFECEQEVSNDDNSLVCDWHTADWLCNSGDLGGCNSHSRRPH